MSSAGSLTMIMSIMSISKTLVISAIKRDVEKLQ
jgi:hypothetical protein